MPEMTDAEYIKECRLLKAFRWNDLCHDDLYVASRSQMPVLDAGLRMCAADYEVALRKRLVAAGAYHSGIPMHCPTSPPRHQWMRFTKNTPRLLSQDDDYRRSMILGARAMEEAG